MKFRSLPPALLASLLAALTIPFLGCGTAGPHAEQVPVMTYSGSNVASTSCGQRMSARTTTPETGRGTIARMANRPRAAIQERLGHADAQRDASGLGAGGGMAWQIVAEREFALRSEIIG